MKIDYFCPEEQSMKVDLMESITVKKYKNT